MYKPLPNLVTIKPSKINGLGLFATQLIKKNTDLGMTHLILAYWPHPVTKQNEVIRTPLGGFINHSEESNCVRLEVTETRWNLKTIKEIKKGEELTLKYTLYDPRGSND